MWNKHYLITAVICLVGAFILSCVSVATAKGDPVSELNALLAQDGWNENRSDWNCADRAIAARDIFIKHGYKPVVVSNDIHAWIEVDGKKYLANERHKKNRTYPAGITVEYLKKPRLRMGD